MPPPPAPLGAAIFDMDGLLVDSEPYWRRVEAEVFSALGADIRPYLGHGYTMGMRVDEAVAFLAAFAGLGEVDLVAVEADVVAGVVQAIGHEAELLPGVEVALGLFEEAGLPRALASGSTPPVIDAVLDRFDLRRRFDGVFTAADDAYGKPHPAIFLRAAAALGVPAEGCVVLEDSLNGCIAAKAARMRVIAVPHPDDAADPRYSIADLNLTSLEELALPAVRARLGLEEVLQRR
ncbi:MAG TPA: hexitol phosphatase HxpB [Acidimicrobiales bacterium]|nr:hexitol phosphatase HxpB [Acidimicrobiales bacterium]